MKTQHSTTDPTRHPVRRFGLITGLVAGGLALSGTAITAVNASPANLGAPGGDTAAGASLRGPMAGDDDRARPRAAAAPTKFACKGGATKKSFTGGYNDWVWTSSTSWTTATGTSYKFKVPRGKDTVSVAVTIPEYWVSSGDYGHYSVLIDGAHMQPGQSWTYADHGSDGTAAQYCKRVGRGWHTVKLVHRVYDGNASGSAWSYLNKAVLHAEVND